MTRFDTEPRLDAAVKALVQPIAGRLPAQRAADILAAADAAAPHMVDGRTICPKCHHRFVLLVPDYASISAERDEWERRYEDLLERIGGVMPS